MRRLLPIGATAGFLAWAAVAWAAVYVPPSDVASLSSAVTSLSATVSSILAKIPVGTSTLVATDYVSTCDVLVDTTATTSVFCPGSAAARTVPGNAWFVGRQWAVDGGGKYTAPLNASNATLGLKVGAGTLSTVTPAALQATDQGIDFHATCTVRSLSGTTASAFCTGMFAFVVLGTLAPVNINGTITFDPTVANVIDATGRWGSTANGQNTTVQNVRLTFLN